MAKFTKPMEWNSEGIEPSETLKKEGFKGGYKPPAEIFNYFLHNSEVCITELQDAVAEAQDTADNAQSTANAVKTAVANAQNTADNAIAAIEELESDVSNTYATKEEAFTKTIGNAVNIADTITLDIGFIPKFFEIYGVGSSTGVYLRWDDLNDWSGNAGPLYDYYIDLDSNTITISTHTALNDSLIWRAFG